MKMVCHALLRSAKRMKEWYIQTSLIQKNAKIARKILTEFDTDVKHAQVWVLETSLSNSCKTPRMVPNAWT
jgi:hypothetical protein